MALDTNAPPLDSRPGILLVGSPNVGKRTILSRLLSVDFGDALDSSDGILCHGWTIDTKYYSADVSIWTAHLDGDFSLGTLPVADKLVALIMVFDLNDLESFSTLKSWVSSVDITKFDILLCIGNKVDLLPGHFAHAEYKRCLQKHEASLGDTYPEFADYGILETEGSSLLGEGEIPWEIRRSCLDWCIQHNLEYVEACASNADFDKCLSVNGDVQGMDRLYGALSAHMWPGMLLKSGSRVTKYFSMDNEDLPVSDEGSDFELEYEVLSGGSAEQWDSDDSWVAFTEAEPQVDNEEGSTSKGVPRFDAEGTEPATSDQTEEHTSTSQLASSPNGNTNSTTPEKTSICEGLLAGCSRQDIEKDGGQSSTPQEPRLCTLNPDDPAPEHGNFELDLDDGKHECIEYEDLEHLMSEIGNMRDNLRLMPDFQRREMAAKLAMKMAAMFGCGSDDEALD